MVWATYDFNYPDATEVNKHGYDVKFTIEDLTEGPFFTYMAYSPKKDVVFLLV